MTEHCKREISQYQVSRWVTEVKAYQEVILPNSESNSESNPPKPKTVTSDPFFQGQTVADRVDGETLKEHSSGIAPRQIEKPDDKDDWQQ
jgi:hypothetical protein